MGFPAHFSQLRPAMLAEIEDKKKRRKGARPHMRGGADVVRAICRAPAEPAEPLRRRACHSVMRKPFRSVLSRHAAAWTAGLLMAACGSSGPLVIVPNAGEPAPPVVRRPVPPAPSPTTAPTVPAAPESPVAIPAGAIYACVVGSGDKRTVTAIEFVPKVATLCAKHPEMGPCQYERDGCRRHGGRVFAANGQEITRATEADYDRKVMRIRMRAD